MELLPDLLFSALIPLGILLFSVTIHELAHAYAADKLGDPTPRIDGRLTLNPLAHLEWFGSLVLPLITMLTSPIVFGWAKPVVFDPYNLRNPRRDTALISFAGPLSNLLIAFTIALIVRFTSSEPSHLTLLTAIVRLNIILAIFNLIPIHPLDGGKILVGLLPYKQAHQVDLFMKRYGMFLIIVLFLPIWGGPSPILSLVGSIVNSLYYLMLG